MPGAGREQGSLRNVTHSFEIFLKNYSFFYDLICCLMHTSTKAGHLSACGVSVQGFPLPTAVTERTLGFEMISMWCTGCVGMWV